MKLNKLFILVAALVLAVFTSCKDEDKFEPGKPAGSYDVTFSDGSNVVLASDATSFDVVLIRDSANLAGELTVPVEVVNAGAFTVSDAKATFTAGSAEAKISVSVPADMKYNTNYPITLRIPEKYTNPYKENITYPMYNVNVLKEDYAVVATAIYYDAFWFEDQWDVEIEYSPSQDLYRVKDVMAEGYNMYFTWDQESEAVVITNSEGKAASRWYPGIFHKNYGEVAADCATYADYFCSYVDEEDGSLNIYLPFKWVVSADSFGVYECYFLNIEFVK